MGTTAQAPDVGLGDRVARDARRVVAGDLTREEFHRRYHEAYLEEFGRDDRPAPEPRAGDDGGDRATAADGPPPPPAGTPPGDEPRFISRRELMGAVGGAAVGALFLGEYYRRGLFRSDLAPAVGVGDAAAGALPMASGSLPVRLGMVIDLQRCDGCLFCVAACREENGLSDGALWPYVFSYTEPGDQDPNFLVRVCQQCTQAPCLLVCPTGARHRRLADGLVLTDYDVCIGCRYCEVACPYGVNYFQWGDPASSGGTFEGDRRDIRGIAVEGDPPRGVMGKCTFCPQRQDDPATRGTTACSEACPMDAIHVGDLNDPDSAPNRYLARRREEHAGNLPTFRLLEDLGTEPNIIYIGSPPSARAELTDGPVSYESWDLTVDRSTVLEGPEPWFRRFAGEA